MSVRKPNDRISTDDPRKPNAITAGSDRNILANSWERNAQRIALQIIPLLDGRPLCEAEYTLKLASRIIATTHIVKAKNARLRALRIECENVPSK
jgi:hypothetical protein